MDIFNTNHLLRLAPFFHHVHYGNHDNHTLLDSMMSLTSLRSSCVKTKPTFPLM